MSAATFQALSVTLLAAALLLSLASLGIHWLRRQEHPDVAQVRQELHSLRLEVLDLTDKTEHWIRRDRTRRLRAGQERKQEEGEQEEAQASIFERPNVKDSLRQAATALRRR